MDSFSVIMVFNLSALWWRRIRGLWKLLNGRDWLRGKLGLVLVGGTMLSKSLIQFSVEGWGCVPSLLFDMRPDYGGDGQVGITNSMDMSLSKLQELVREDMEDREDREAWRAAVHGVTKSRTWLSDWTELNIKTCLAIWILDTDSPIFWIVALLRSCCLTLDNLIILYPISSSTK